MQFRVAKIVFASDNTLQIYYDENLLKIRNNSDFIKMKIQMYINILLDRLTFDGK